MSEIAFSSTDATASLNMTTPSKKRRKFLKPSLCLRCRKVQLVNLLLGWPFAREQIYSQFRFVTSLKIDSCDYCQLFFSSLPTDVVERYEYIQLRLHPFSQWDVRGTPDFFNRRLLSARPNGKHIRNYVELFAMQGSRGLFKNSLFPIKYALPGNTIPPFISMASVRRWLARAGVTREDGVTNDKYQSEANSIPGLIVIDCKSKSLALVPLPSDGLYVTLSYVWGPQQTGGEIVTNSLPLKLPETIQDAITVCNSLGLRFLWIDRYCIPQADEQEKSRLVACMDKIYNSSSITLIACVGSNPYHGLTGVSLPRTKNPCIRGYQLIPSKDEVISSAWASRGWTFQEALLSRRQLYFTERQLIFQAKDCVESELIAGCVADYEPYLDHIFQFEQRYSVERLSSGPLRCIEDYSDRVLSRPEDDRLTALYGIFSVYEKQGTRHLWGLPYSITSYKDALYLASSLFWRRQSPRVYSDTIPRYKRFPTWSWASCPDPISFVRPWEHSGSTAKPQIEIKGLELLAGDFVSWRDYQVLHHTISYDEQYLSTCLHIVAIFSTPLRFSLGDEKLGDEKGTVKVLHSNLRYYSHTVNIMFDSLEDMLDSQDVLVAVHPYDPAEERDSTAEALVLHEKGDHWQRIGLCSGLAKIFSEWKTESKEFRLR